MEKNDIERLQKQIQEQNDLNRRDPAEKTAFMKRAGILDKDGRLNPNLQANKAGHG